jgi:hypothetical protein
MMNGQCTSIPAVKFLIPAAVTHDRHPVDILQAVGCIMVDVDCHSSRAMRLHPSLKAFITDHRRCTDDRFYIDAAVHHASIHELALGPINRFVVHNICQLDDTSLLNSDIPAMQERINRLVPTPLLYASRHWADHLLNVKPSEGRVLEHLREFFFRHLLHWIELSSVTGQVDAGLASLQAVLEWLRVCIVL